MLLDKPFERLKVQGLCFFGLIIAHRWSEKRTCTDGSRPDVVDRARAVRRSKHWWSEVREKCGLWTSHFNKNGLYFIFLGFWNHVESFFRSLELVKGLSLDIAGRSLAVMTLGDQVQPSSSTTEGVYMRVQEPRLRVYNQLASSPPPWGGDLLILTYIFHVGTWKM